MKFVASYSSLLATLVLRRKCNGFPLLLPSKGRAFRSFSSTPLQGHNGGWDEDSMTSMARKRPCIVAGNWKLNPTTLSEASNLLKLIAANFANHRIASSTDVPEVVVFPPFPFLSLALAELDGTGIKVGAQNVGLHSSGAFTGEVSASMIRSIGCDYVLLGHSERRSVFKESDEQINKKVHLCLEQPNLKIILCVGETEREYNSNLLSSVVDLQIKKGLAGVGTAVMDRIVVAYEPVWAIESGKVAKPEQANKAHKAVRKSLAEMFGENVADQCCIQYSGNVNPENVVDLLSMDEIDGALVGAASLSADSFTRIVDGATPGLSYFRPVELSAQECLPTKNVLGESPVWSDRDQCLYWVSSPEQEVWRWDMRTPAYRRLVGTTLGCVVLKEGSRGSIVLGGESAILEMEMTATTRDFSNGATFLCDRPDLESTTRPNDGRVDRQGRLVFGMYNNYHRSGSSEGENNAGLFRLGPDLEYEKILDYDFRVSNCICFPADGKTMYFCDTPTRKVYAFDYPEERGGQLSNRRLVWTVPPNLQGGPDGAQVDEDGFLWIALSGAGRVVRVNPSTGVVEIVIHLPVKSPTSCTFGGLDRDNLFITTRGPDGGGLFRVKMPYGIRGLPEPEFVVGESHMITQGRVPLQQESHGTYH